MFAIISTRFFATKVVAPRSASVSSAPRVPAGTKINPYAFFIKENFKTDSSKKKTDVMKELSETWKSLSVSKKDKYVELSKLYNEKKVDEFLKLSSEEQDKLFELARQKKEERAKRRHTKERREKRKLSGRPTVPPSSYTLFIKEKLSGCGIEANKKMKEAVAQWKTLSEAQKQKYIDEAEILKKEYHSDLERWEAEQKEKKSN